MKFFIFLFLQKLFLKENAAKRSFSLLTRHRLLPEGRSSPALPITTPGRRPSWERVCRLPCMEIHLKENRREIEPRSVHSFCQGGLDDLRKSFPILQVDVLQYFLPDDLLNRLEEIRRAHSRPKKQPSPGDRDDNNVHVLGDLRAADGHSRLCVDECDQVGKGGKTFLLASFDRHVLFPEGD